MNSRRLLSAALLVMSLMTTACPSPDPDPGPGPGDPGPGDPGPGDPGPTPLPTDPNDPNNDTKDTDCDGLSDKVEFTTTYEEGKKTNPGVADTDQDGLPDGLEVGITKPVAGTSCTITPDASSALKTSPVIADTDGDGLLDGVEDANKNGKVDDNETHPRLKDSDCDGLRDGPTEGDEKGEDQNANGKKDDGETSPLKFDTDGDGISDGVESGVTTNLDEANCKGIFVPDLDPTHNTDATNPDSDGDGVNDGAEDNNQNGRTDPGELDPSDGSDASGPAGQVCTASNLRPVTFKAEDGPDVKLALPPTFNEVTQIKSGTEVKGLVGYDSTTKTAFLAFRTKPAADSTTPLGDEEDLQPAINSKGALRNRTAQVFKTWDGFEAVQAFYDQSGGTTDLKTRTNQLVDALVPGSSGRLNSAAGVVGDFRLQSLFVHRSNQSLVVLIALAPLAGVTEGNRSSPAAFSIQDLSDGSALAQFGEPTAVQCERFQIQTSRVDFLFVVDDSGSMQTSQQSLAATAKSAADALNASSLDWRMALVTSSYHLGSGGNNNVNKLRRFTRNVNKVTAWLTQNSQCSNGTCSGVPTTPERATCPGDNSQGVNGGCWVGINGDGDEGVLGAARKAIDDMTPGTAPGTESDTKARSDATLVVVLLGDADDQTTGYTTATANCGGSVDRDGGGCENVDNFIKFFGTGSEIPKPTNKTGRHIIVHGIVCPSGEACGCNNGQPCSLSNVSREFNPQPVNGVSKLRHTRVVNATGGVLGSIMDTGSIKASMSAIIGDAIGNAGYKTLKPPIGASLKVAAAEVLSSTCNAKNIPRSTINGFDFDGSARTLSFFGACRPRTDTTQVAVSYQYWVNAVKDPNGGIPCKDDPNYSETEPDHCVGQQLGCDEASNQCVCKPDCGGCGTGTRCNMNACACVPIIG